jgi:hypothetical protein
MHSKSYLGSLTASLGLCKPMIALRTIIGKNQNNGIAISCIFFALGANNSQVTRKFLQRKKARLPEPFHSQHPYWQVRRSPPARAGDNRQRDQLTRHEISGS